MASELDKDQGQSKDGDPVYKGNPRLFGVECKVLPNFLGTVDNTQTLDLALEKHARLVRNRLRELGRTTDPEVMADIQAVMKKLGVTLYPLAGEIVVLAYGKQQQLQYHLERIPVEDQPFFQRYLRFRERPMDEHHAKNWIRFIARPHEALTPKRSSRFRLPQLPS